MSRNITSQKRFNTGRLTANGLSKINKKRKTEMTVTEELIEKRIFLIRGKKAIIDRHLAELYSVETGALNRAVKRNPGRFPTDFMFQLTQTEFEDLRCQIGISNQRGGARYLDRKST